MEGKIIFNAIKTPDGTILHSKHRHDFVMYKDKNGKEYGVDGGNEYLRRIGNTNECVDISLTDNGDHLKRREYLCWGVNYDKDMKRLSQTEWKYIKDMTTDHIQSILNGGFVENNSFYKNIFEQELIFRKNEK